MRDVSTSGPDAVDPEDMSGSDHSDVPADVDGAYLFGISRDGTPFYYDDDHLSRWGAAFLVERLDRDALFGRREPAVARDRAP